MALTHTSNRTTDRRIQWPAGAGYITLPFSVSLWFRNPNAVPSSVYHIAISCGDTASTPWHMSGYNAQNKIGISVRYSNNTANYRVESATGTPWDGKWHFACASVQTGTNATKVFLDALSAGVGTVSDILSIASPRVALLGLTSSSTVHQFAGGSVSDVRIWDTALSDDEVAMLRTGYMRDGMDGFIHRYAIGDIGPGSSVAGKNIFDHVGAVKANSIAGDPNADFDPYSPFPICE